MVDVGHYVTWTTSAGVHSAGVVRWIAPGTDTLHITCDPKNCDCGGWGPWHVTSVSEVELQDTAVPLW